MHKSFSLLYIDCVAAEMALSLDDKLLGEKTHYYCSSSEDEGEEDVGSSTQIAPLIV